MKTTAKLISLALVSSVVLSLSGCGTMSKQDVGLLSGAAIGGLVGSRFGGGNGQLIATGVGAIAGAYIGQTIGKDMDRQDRMRMNEALNHAQDGQTVGWTNNQGVHYSMTPEPAPQPEIYTAPQQYSSNSEPNFKRAHHHRKEHRKYCREFTMNAVVAGKPNQQLSGNACRNPDGTWTISDKKSR